MLEIKDLVDDLSIKLTELDSELNLLKGKLGCEIYDTYLGDLSRRKRNIETSIELLKQFNKRI